MDSNHLARLRTDLPKASHSATKPKRDWTFLENPVSCMFTFKINGNDENDDDFQQLADLQQQSEK